MLKTNPTWFCDACGKKIEGYKGRVELNTPEGGSDSVGLDFCKDCMVSFIEWKKSRITKRRRKND